MVAGSAGMAAVSESGPRSIAPAWVLGVVGALACAAGAAMAIAFGAPPSFLFVYLVGVLMGLLGALIASRDSHNSIGWLMIATSLATCFLHLPARYGYEALVIQNGAWPFGSLAVWFGAWGWVPVLGLSLPLIAVRFPDGKVPHRWRAVDWLAIAGTILFSASIALQPPAILIQFLAIPGTAVDLLSSRVQNPLGFSVASHLLIPIQGAGLSLIVLGYVGAAGSVAARFRHARGEERLQLKWFAYAGALVAVCLVYGAVAWNFFGQPLYLALTPVMAAYLTVPVAIGIAVLRYRLYDIDLIINRTLVYASLTAILGGVYVAGIEFLQRLFIYYTGQKSETAIIVTVFAVATLFTPAQKWVERLVEQRLGGRGPAEKLEALTASVEAVTRVIDPHQVARRLVDDAVAAFQAVGGSLYLDSYDHSQPFHSNGQLGAEHALEVAVRHAERNLGKLLLGHRRGHVPYSEHDRAVIQRSAEALGEALAVGHEFGHVHQPKPASM
jgi:hypothetical protein